MMRKYPRAPHPFVIEPPLEDKTVYEPGETLQFSMVLIGKGGDYLPYFVYAFEELGRTGTGNGKGKYWIETVWCGDDVIYNADTRTLGELQKQAFPAPSPEPVERITLAFLTPTRIKYEEQLAPEPEFHVLIRSLLRRVSALYYFHASNRLELDFKGIVERAEAVRTVRRDLSWIDWARYSARQDARMKLGGFVGTIEFEGDLTEFMPLLRIGEIVHIGKATSFGLGKYVVSPPPDE